MLSINISEVIWTIVNFLLLTFLLKKFLYDPIIKFMDERNARIAAADNEMKEAQENKARIEAETAEKREQTRDEARRVIADGKAENERKRAATVSGANAEELQHRKAMKLDVSKEKEELKAELNENEASLAEMLAKQLLNE